MSRPPTYDEDNIVLVQALTIDTKLKDKEYRIAWHRNLMAGIRALPDVRAASAARTYLWMEWDLSSRVKAANDTAAVGVDVAAILADDALPEALGVTIDEGRWFTKDEVEGALRGFPQASPRQKGPDGKWNESRIFDVVVTRELGEQLFGKGPLVGRMLEEPDGDKGRIIGVLEGYSAPAQTNHHERYAVFWPGDFYLNWGTFIVVRAKAGKAAAVAPRIDEILAATGEVSDDTVRTMLVSDLRQFYFGAQQVTVTLMGLLIFLLLLIGSVNTAGHASFSVTQRTRQIGVRRALGATPNDILAYFLSETGIITVIGLALGAGLSIPLNMAILRFYDGAKLQPGIVAGCALLLFLVALASALPPARRASKISPAIATRNV